MENENTEDNVRVEERPRPVEIVRECCQFPSRVACELVGQRCTCQKEGVLKGFADFGDSAFCANLAWLLAMPSFGDRIEVYGWEYVFFHVDSFDANPGISSSIE